MEKAQCVCTITSKAVIIDIFANIFSTLIAWPFVSNISAISRNSAFFWILERFKFRNMLLTKPSSLLKSNVHSSEIRGLQSTKCSSETLQKLLYFMYEKTLVVFTFFISCNFIFLPYECPSLCGHRPGHS